MESWIDMFVVSYHTAYYIYTGKQSDTYRDHLFSNHFFPTLQRIWYQYITILWSFLLQFKPNKYCYDLAIYTGST